MEKSRDPQTGFLNEEHFLQRLEEEIDRAGRDDRWYSIVVCTPQHLPGEGVDDIVRAAAECVQGLVRDHDLPGHLAGDVLAVGLPDTDPAGARVFAYRAQGDLRVCSYKLRNTLWEAGHATFPEDGQAWWDVLYTAANGAKSRRARFAEAPHWPPLPMYIPSPTKS